MTSRQTTLVIGIVLAAFAVPIRSDQAFVTNLCAPGVCIGTADQRSTQIWSGGRPVLTITPSSVMPVGAITLGSATFPFTLPGTQTLPPSCTSGQAPISDGASGWACGSAGIPTGTGHPQGVLAAAVGSLYIDTATGYRYAKLGGAATAYGWYYDSVLGSGYTTGPYIWQTSISADANAASPGQASGFGWMQNVAGTTFTATGVTTTAMVYSTGKIFKSFATAAVDPTVMYLAHPSSTVMRYWELDLDCAWSMKTGPSVAASRWWTIFSTSAITDAEDNAGQAIGFRFSTVVPDAGWVGYTRDATTASVTASLGAVAANTEYLLRMRLVRSGTPTAYFSINNGTEIAKTTNLPATGVTSFPSWGVTTKAAVAKAYLWRSIGCVFGS